VSALRETLNPHTTHDERRATGIVVEVNNLPDVAFQWLSHPAPLGGSIVKRIATTLLVAGLIATPMFALPPSASAAISVGISIGIAPPPLPVYEQPVVPGPGYIWTPGYWAWGGDGYYWVPGTWVMPPEVGLLWTPGWWGWSDGYYHWHDGYWAPQVGFYGGINYGYGYFGAGYDGGYWRGREFYYNRAVNNVNVNIRNVYVNRTVVRNVNVRRASYNGGRGGISAQPTSRQRAVAKERRWSPTSMQTRQRDVAKQNPAQHVRSNGGHPAVFATQHPGKFEGPHAVRTARSAPRARPTNAPNREHGTVQAPRGRAHAAPQPRATSTPNREHATMQAPHAHATGQAPRERAHPAPQPRPMSAPNRERGTVQAPPQRAQPMRPQPSNAPVRGNARPNPPPPRGASQRRNPPPHSAQSGQSQPRASHANDHGKAHHDKHKPDNGQHR
jgi:hypothetical protein